MYIYLLLLPLNWAIMFVKNNNYDKNFSIFQYTKSLLYHMFVSYIIIITALFLTTAILISLKRSCTGFIKIFINGIFGLSKFVESSLCFLILLYCLNKNNRKKIGFISYHIHNLFPLYIDYIKLYSTKLHNYICICAGDYYMNKSKHIIIINKLIGYYKKANDIIAMFKIANFYKKLNNKKKEGKYLCQALLKGGNDIMYDSIKCGKFSGYYNKNKKNNNKNKLINAILKRSFNYNIALEYRDYLTDKNSIKLDKYLEYIFNFNNNKKECHICFEEEKFIIKNNCKCNINVCVDCFISMKDKKCPSCKKLYI